MRIVETRARGQPPPLLADACLLECGRAGQLLRPPPIIPHRAPRGNRCVRCARAIVVRTEKAQLCLFSLSLDNTAAFRGWFIPSAGLVWAGRKRTRVATPKRR